MATRLNLKNTQQLTINPVIHTFIGFLPLNRVEFVDKIRNEVEANPMLDIETPGADSSKAERDVTDIEKRLERADSSFLNEYREESFLKSGSDRLDKNRARELFTASTVTLSDSLMEQAMSQFDEKELEIARQIIYNLNHDGYLDIEIESTASSLNTTPAEIERIRNIIKNFEPRGVASRTLKECLLAQVDDTPENEMLIRLIEDHLEDLSKSKYNDIIKKLDIQKEELTKLIIDLKRLDPKPGTDFEKENIDYAEVDLLLIKEDNEYKVRFIDDGVPRMVLSSYYEQMMNQSPDKKARSYLKDKFRNAQLFIEGINL